MDLFLPVWVLRRSLYHFVLMPYYNKCLSSLCWYSTPMPSKPILTWSHPEFLRYRHRWLSKIRIRGSIPSTLGEYAIECYNLQPKLPASLFWNHPPHPRGFSPRLPQLCPWVFIVLCRCISGRHRGITREIDMVRNNYYVHRSYYVPP